MRARSPPCASAARWRKSSRATAGAGFDGVEIFENDLIARRSHPAEVREPAADLGLTIDLYQPFRDFEAVPPRSSRATCAAPRRSSSSWRDLGADTMLVCSNVAPDAIDDDELAAEQLRELARARGRPRRADRLRGAGLGPARQRRTSTPGGSSSAADHPRLGTCLDTFHMLSRDDDPAAIDAIPGEQIFYLQVADAPRLTMDPLSWSRHYRCFPGPGRIRPRRLLATVLAAGYTGPLSLEVFNDVFRQADPHQTAIDAMRSLIVLEDPRSCTAAAAAALSGFAFAELGVDAHSGAGEREPAARDGLFARRASTVPSPSNCGSQNDLQDGR